MATGGSSLDVDKLVISDQAGRSCNRLHHFMATSGDYCLVVEVGW